MIIVGCRIMITYTYMPCILDKNANQDMWIAQLIGLLFSIVISLPILFISKKYNSFSLGEFNEFAFGKAAGKSVSLLFAIYFFAITLFFTVIALAFIVSSVFPDTPVWGLILYIFIPVAFMAYQGAGTISRVAVIIFPYVILTIIVFFLASMKEYDISALLPAGADSTAGGLLGQGFNIACMFSEIMIVPFFCQRSIRKVKSFKTVTFALVAVTVLSIIMILPSFFFMGLEVAKRAWNPYYFFTRLINSSEIIQRIEPLNITAWFMALLVKLAAYTYMGSELLADVFGRQKRRMFSLLSSFLMSALSLIPVMTYSETIDTLRNSRIPYIVTLIFVFVIPIISIAFAALREKKHRPEKKT